MSGFSSSGIQVISSILSPLGAGVLKNIGCKIRTRKISVFTFRQALWIKDMKFTFRSVGNCREYDFTAPDFQ